MKVDISKPTLCNIASMLEIVDTEVENGNILHRSADEIATTIRSYSIALNSNTIIGFVALHIHNEKLAEIRSLVVKEKFRGEGVGSYLIESAINEAKSLGVKEVLVLTYNKSLYTKYNFIEIDKESLPEHKIWTDCIKCIHFPICDEIALLKTF